ncbi:hypothetical protein JKF63_02897 [Porcisia hertigi]|uniref:Uncharacterized protein n=1 Tax=Porcisia hertigi TaxID=2761500 RepID=A0A836IIT4_9TRYP|nr:hypothetical protein JKF63_02897 [Porcisia hertigi]
MRAQPLRLRIAEIFTLLCRHGGGAAVSDALLYGSCRTASELMAQRCHIVFSSFSNARWKVATALTPTPSTPLALSAGPVSTESFASPHSDHLRASARSGTHVMNQMLCALVDLHTCAASATRIPEMRPSPCSTTGTIVEADVVATGVLLRALLHCPPLHKRIVRLFSGDVHAIEPQHHRRGAQDVEVVSSSVSSAQSPQMFLPPSSSSGGVDMVDTRRHLHIFLPVLTHASPIVSAESWRTLAVLLFPSPAASLSSAVRRLLLLVPACPLQHLLAATLALPEDDSDGTRASAPLRPKPALLSCSHPMARNNALRLLHVLCTSTDLPPAVQSLFHQSPALLWRVLRLAAAVCKGIAVAHVALVRRVLVDYVMFSVEHRCSSGGGRPYPRTRFSVSTQTLLRENRGALARFLASTYAVWEGGDGFLAPEGAGGEWASACATASASMENGYDEGQILAVLHAL